MPRYVTVTPAKSRSAAVTLVARSAAASRSLLIGSAAKASIVASRVVGAALSRGRTALVPVRAAGVLLANVVARRPLAGQTLAARLVVAGLGARRTVAALIAGVRSGVAGMVRRRPGVGAVPGARSISAVAYRGRVMFDSVLGSRTVAVAPYTSRNDDVQALTDNLGANIVDSSGGNILGDLVTITTSYLRWRVLAPVVTGVRAVAASPLAERLLSASARSTRTVSASMRNVRQLAANFAADVTVPRFIARLFKEEYEAVTVVGRRVVVANVYGIKPESATILPATGVSALLWNQTPITDSSGNPITDASSVQFTALA